MAQVVWKYPFEVDDIVKITVPKGAQPLHVEEQGHRMCLWVKCNPEVEEREEMILRFAGTGHTLDMERDGKFYDSHHMFYINTVTVFNAALVFHIFWYIDPKLLQSDIEAEVAETSSLE